MTEDGLVELVASALCSADTPLASYEEKAKAVIAALREPTEAQIAVSTALIGAPIGLLPRFPE